VNARSGLLRAARIFEWIGHPFKMNKVVPPTRQNLRLIGVISYDRIYLIYL
jgi:hypothetical protein